ncbi:MAG TPA: TIGR02679 domain-containing protein, partial [Paenisporosarcina sp.]|nr:TIGR02679 domain-containing protein [Paenisporosarcina sp.]
MTEDLKAALAYFTSQSVYSKLFKAFREKFESYGRLSGAVKIDRYTEDELQELALFIGTTTDTLRKKKTLKITHFEQALKATKFGSITLLELLEAYYKESFVSKKNKALHQLDEENLRMNNWRLAYAELADWFDVVQGRTMDVQWILRLMREVDFEQKLTLLQ